MCEVLLDVQHLTHYFKINSKIKIRAVDDLSFQIRRGEIFGLVGESGCPKAYRRNKKMLQTSRQMIFQDSASSLNGRMKVAEIIAEPMEIHHIRPPRGSLRREAEFQLHYVGMEASYLDMIFRW